MPIRTNKVHSLNLFSIKRAIEKLSNSSLNLQNPSGTDKLYVTTEPGTDDLAEGQAVYYVNGEDSKLYVKINGAIKSATLT